MAGLVPAKSSEYRLKSLYYNKTRSVLETTERVFKVFFQRPIQL